jgi:hypothetical protein
MPVRWGLLDHHRVARSGLDRKPYQIAMIADWVEC